MDSNCMISLLIDTGEEDTSQKEDLGKITPLKF